MSAFTLPSITEESPGQEKPGGTTRCENYERMLLIGFPAQPAFLYNPRPSAQDGAIHCEPGPHAPTINLDNVHRLAYTTV